MSKLATVSKRYGPVLFPLAALIVLLLVNLAINPGFFNLTVQDGRIYGSLIDILNRAAPVALIAVGMTLVIATGGVDLSVGSVMAIAGSAAACLIERPAGSPLSGLDVSGMPGILAISLGIALLCGLFNGLLVSVFRLQPIVATLLLMVAGRGVAQLLAGGQPVSFRHPGLESIATGSTLLIPNPVWITLFLFAAVGLLVRKTALGLFLESVGNNAEASRRVGIRATATKTAAYALTGLCAGIAGLIATGDIRSANPSDIGLYLELDAILAVAIGGTALSGGRFYLAGTLVGAFLMQTVTTTVYSLNVPYELNLVIKAVIVVAVCLFQSEQFRRRFHLRRREAVA